MLGSKGYLLTTVRVLVGLVVPIGIINFSDTNLSEIMLVLLLAGDLIDRYEFYNDIFIVTPSVEFEQILENRIKKWIG